MIARAVDRRSAILVAIIILAGAACTATAYWPGLMTWDAARQYGQAIDGQFDDWHPPAMEWLWRQLVPIHSGPAPMLVLQLILYWSGYALLAVRALVARRHRLALAFAACGLMPFALALMGAVLKDCLMAGALLSATGLLAWVDERPRAAFRLIGIALLLFAATLRFNAFLACVPIGVALLPPVWRRGPWRLGGVTIAATIACLLMMPIVNRALDARRSGVALSLVIFDLGGITERGGISVFPAMGVADPVAANHRCYSPMRWDPYSDWVDPPCPLGFVPFRATIARTGQSPYRLWAGAIVAHPFAYAEHRLQHAAINTRLIPVDARERPVQRDSAPNDWGYRVTPGTLLAGIDGVAIATAATPFGWPIVWMALALGVLIAGQGMPSRGFTTALALSSVCYGLGYGIFSVAPELRYHLWTMIAALIATISLIADLIATNTLSWRYIRIAFAPAIGVALFASLLRLYVAA